MRMSLIVDLRSLMGFLKCWVRGERGRVGPNTDLFTFRTELKSHKKPRLLLTQNYLPQSPAFLSQTQQTCVFLPFD